MTMKVVEDIEGGESRGSAVAKMRAMIDSKLGPGSAAEATTFGQLRSLLNDGAPLDAQIQNGELGSGVRAKLNGWHNMLRAPIFLAPPTIAPSSGPVGTAFTVSPGDLAGSLPMLRDGTLMQSGQPVAQRQSGEPFVFTSTQEGPLAWSETASNGAGSVSAQASAEVYLLDPDAAALFERFEVEPSEERKQLINDRFIAGKATTWWSKLDALWVHAAHAPEAGRLNWLSTSFNCLPVNNPAFEVDRGYTGDGVSSYLDSQFNPAVQVPLGSKFQRDSASMGIRSNINNQANGSLIGFFDGSSGVSMNPRNANNSAAYRVNQGAQLTSGNGTIPSAVGMFAVTRTGASAVALYRQGGLIASGTTASNPVANGNLRLGAITDTSLRSCQFAMGWIGGGLTADEVRSIFEWFQPYRTALGIE